MAGVGKIIENEVLNLDFFIRGYFTRVVQIIDAERLVNANSSYRFKAPGIEFWQNVVHYKAVSFPSICARHEREAKTLTEDFHSRFDKVIKRHAGPVRFAHEANMLINKCEYLDRYPDPVLRDWVRLMLYWQKHLANQTPEGPVIFEKEELR